MSAARIIELTEYSPRTFEREEIDYAIAETLWHKYNTQIAIDFPSLKTGGKWKLTSQGWVGHIPLTPELHLALLPKVQLKNLFGMLEYAYQLKSFCFLEGLIDCQSLEDFYSQLAYLLARRILNRGRKGFYRTYIPKTGQLAYIRGRMDIRQAMQKPWNVKLSCHYEEHTGDIEDNQILAWTLFIIGRSGLCSERVAPTVRQAYHALQGFVRLQPSSPEDCVGRLYSRLNEDYRSLHALCRFFLDSSGASHERGDRTMLPFLVKMDRLYELFIAEWLKAHLPQNFLLKFQEQVNIGKSVHFKTDLVLYDVSSGTASYILDTKYKIPTQPAADDIAQVVAYAVSKHCHEAVLVYPEAFKHSLDEWIGGIRVRSLTFSLKGDLEQAGQTFLQDLFVSP
ncbi:MAG TPA: restriction endonuclease [Chroococcales cyanobacterium]